MKGLLVIAHGSRRAQANDEFLQFVDQIKINVNQDFDSIHGCFLELAKPQIIETAIEMVAEGVSSLWVLPYFLTFGKHMEKDIPEDLKAVAELLHQKGIPLKIDMLPHVGASTAMLDLVEEALLVCTDNYPNCLPSSTPHHLH